MDDIMEVEPIKQETYEILVKGLEQGLINKIAVRDKQKDIIAKIMRLSIDELTDELLSVVYDRILDGDIKTPPDMPSDDEDIDLPMGVVEDFGTPFYVVYCAFLSKVTDEMYAETWTEQDTYDCLEDLLIESLGKFRFPKFRPFEFSRAIVTVRDEFDNDLSRGAFRDTLSTEEIEILAQLMRISWLDRQICTTQLTRMKIGSSDWKISSQANQLDKLTKLKESYVRENKNEQMWYRRRTIDEDGYIVPNFKGLAETKDYYREVDWWKDNPYFAYIRQGVERDVRKE